MKANVKQIMLAVMIVVAAANSVQAKETKSTIEPERKTYKKIGLHGGISLNAVINTNGKNDGCSSDCFRIPPVLPGKVDFNVGYQFNPYISLDAKVWTLLFFVWGVEIAPKISLTDSKVSPFVTASYGVATARGDSVNYFGYGGGVDFHLTKHTSIFGMARWIGNPQKGVNVHGVLPEFGIQFKF